MLLNNKTTAQRRQQDPYSLDLLGFMTESRKALEPLRWIYF
jgi:hypothetical protein